MHNVADLEMLMMHNRVFCAEVGHCAVYACLPARLHGVGRQKAQQQHPVATYQTRVHVHIIWQSWLWGMLTHPLMLCLEMQRIVQALCMAAWRLVDLGLHQWQDVVHQM